MLRPGASKFEHGHRMHWIATDSTSTTTAALLLVVALLCLGCNAPSQAPRVVSGELDLTGWNFAADGPAQLQGDWEVCWGTFTDPGSSECPAG